MLDTKKILQLGIGVAVGMIAWHFIQKAMNAKAERANASGDSAYTPCATPSYQGVTCQSFCQDNYGANAWDASVGNYGGCNTGGSSMGGFGGTTIRRKIARRSVFS